MAHSMSPACLAPIDLEAPGAAAALLTALRCHSYACVALPDAASEAVDKLLALAPGFFASRQLEPSSRNYFGFHKNVTRDKEVLFARLTADGSLNPSGELCAQGCSMFAEAAGTAFRELHACAARALSAIARGLGAAPGQHAALLDSPSGQPRGGGEDVSASYLSLFGYGINQLAGSAECEATSVSTCASPSPPEGQRLPCDEHVDYSLLTLAPFMAEPGLEVLDLRSCEWVCPEVVRGAGAGCGAASRRNLAVLMVGESLEMLSNNVLCATMHRVAPRFQRRRLSCPLLLHPRDNAWLDPASFGAGAGSGRPPQLAGRFIAESQRAKQSVIYTQ